MSKFRKFWGHIKTDLCHFLALAAHARVGVTIIPDIAIIEVCETVTPYLIIPYAVVFFIFLSRMGVWL